jgi:hypothetical protein
MTPDELLETVIERYYDSDLPVEPEERLAALRDVIVAEWGAMPARERILLAVELDETGDLAGFAEEEPELSTHELQELDEQAVDGLVDRARLEIPELSPPDAAQL